MVHEGDHNFALGHAVLVRVVAGRHGDALAIEAQADAISYEFVGPNHVVEAVDLHEVLKSLVRE